MQFRAVLALLVLAGPVAVLSPWAIRNTWLQSVLTVVDTMGEMNLRMGNCEYTLDDRMWDVVSLPGERNWSFALRRSLRARTFTGGQKDRWAQRMVGGSVRAHPADVQRGLVFPPVWEGFGASAVILLAHGAVAIAAAAGICLAPADWRAHTILVLPPLGILAGQALAFGHPRYHLPLMLIFDIDAAALAVQSQTVLRTAARWQLVGAALSVKALLAIWVNQVLVVDAAPIRALLDGVLGS